jgi:hypothetical protein
MKNAWRARTFAMIGSVLAVAGCSSTQPDSIDTRQASVSFSASALVGLYNCYDVYQDSDPPDGIPDLFIQFLCEPVIEQTPGGPVQTRVTRAVPWRYSLKITVIPAGGVDEQVVLSSDGALVGSSVEPGDFVDNFISLTNYDPDQPPVPDKNTGDLYFINGKRVSAGSPIYLSTIFIDPGIPNILTEPQVFPFNLNTGDTVIVRARKQLFVDAPPFLPGIPDPDIQITASLAVSGVTVSIQGTTVSTIEDAAGVTFSFTVQ